MEAQVRFEILSNFANEPLEWQLANKEVGALLELPDLAQCYGSRAVSVGFLNTTSKRSRLAGCLCRQLLPWRLSTSRLSGGLLRASHLPQAKNHTPNDKTTPKYSKHVLKNSGIRGNCAIYSKWLSQHVRKWLAVVACADCREGW